MSAPVPSRSSTTAAPIHRGQMRWRVGDVLEVWIGEVVRHRGVVEESAPTLGVVWIREHGTGMRLLIDLGEPGIRLRRCDSPQAPR